MLPVAIIYVIVPKHDHTVASGGARKTCAPLCPCDRRFVALVDIRIGMFPVVYTQPEPVGGQIHQEFVLHWAPRFWQKSTDLCTFCGG